MYKRQRLAFGHQLLPVHQFLLNSDLTHKHNLFVILGTARNYLGQYFSSSCATDDRGDFEHKRDKTWHAPKSVVDAWRAGNWTSINWHDDVLLSMTTHRAEALAWAKVGKVADQWFHARRDDVLMMANRGLAALGYDRYSVDDPPEGLSPVVNQVLRLERASMGAASAREHALRTIQAALREPGSNFANWLRSSPGAAFPSFLDACLLYTSPSPRDVEESRMPSSA